MTMRKQLAIIGVTLVLAAPALVGAATVWNGSRYTLAQDQSKGGNVYAVSEETLVAGNVGGDLVTAGNSVIVSGVVGEDILAAGGTVQVTGSVSGDVRVGGGKMLIAGKIGGDLVTLGGQLFAARGSTIGGDVVSMGGDMTIESAVAGRIRATGGEVVINGPVAGDIEVEGGRLVLRENAIVNGDIRFRGPQAPIVMPGATVNGKIDFARDDFGSRRFGMFANGAGVVAAAILLLISLVTALLLFTLFTRQTHAFAHSALYNPWKNAGHGIVAFVLFVVVSALLLLTIVGIPAGVIGFLSLGILVTLANALAGIVFGTWAARYIFKQHSHLPNATSVIWGTIALRLISVIPVIGWFVAALFFCMSFGILSYAAYQQFWLARK